MCEKEREREEKRKCERNAKISFFTMRSFLSCWVLIAHASAMENRERGERAVGGGGGLEIALVLEAWYRLTRKTTAAIAPHEPFAKWLFRHSAHLAAAAAPAG